MLALAASKRFWLAVQRFSVDRRSRRGSPAAPARAGRSRASYGRFSAIQRASADHSHQRLKSQGGGSTRLQVALWTFAAVALVAAPRAQDAAREGSVLSPGRQFAEQGGAAIYANVCAACHQRDGKGADAAGAYPALAGDQKLASAGYALRVLLAGSKAMPPLGRMMTDEQAADVINYVRTHFGNDYRDAVTVAAVKSARPPSPQGQ
jgi:mono/diheme cytochrome c family protein